ncbi:MAG: GtrA family protein [Patescibacteria group bacterium]|nr:GtrA family protein [Patescibacteria group bacterium]
MILKLIRWAWSMRHQFIKYFITGISAVILDIISLYALKEYAGLRPVYAVIINQIFLLNFVFFVNKYWSFKAQGMTTRQAVKFLCVAGVNYLIAVIWMWFFNERLGLNYLLARVINIAIAVAWNFLLYRYFVYRVFQPALPVNKPDAGNRDVIE